MTQKDLTELIQNRRYLHACPEIGLHLPKTKAFVIKKLTEYGLTPTECGRSITAFIGKKRGKILYPLCGGQAHLGRAAAHLGVLQRPQSAGTHLGSLALPPAIRIVT